MKRNKTKKIMVGNVQIGGQNKVVIQSMCNIKTSKYEEVAKQINECALLGAELMRVSIMDEEDALAITEIKKRISIPLIGDIHFDYHLALLAIENGIDKIRINPGNIGSMAGIKKVVEACKAHKIPIRVGVNSGSIDKKINDGSQHVSAKNLVESAKKHVQILEKLGFTDIVVSLKGSSVLQTIEAYKLASKEFKYPLHIGITEAGVKEIGIIRSVAGLSPLLLEGIGDTVRISLSGNPTDEVKTAKRLLHDLGLYPNYPTLISCPTCGRTMVDVEKVAHTILDYLETVNKPITVAVMGCIVNGPGEASQADIGIAGGRHSWVVFKEGKTIKTASEKDIVDVLIKEIEKI